MEMGGGGCKGIDALREAGKTRDHKCRTAVQSSEPSPRIELVPILGRGNIPLGGSRIPMQKATSSARSGRKSGGCYAFDNRAKPDAESDEFGAVSGRRSGGCYVSLKRAKADAKSGDFGGWGWGGALRAGGGVACVPITQQGEALRLIETVSVNALP